MILLRTPSGRPLKAAYVSAYIVSLSTGGSSSACSIEPAFGRRLSSPSECQPQPARLMPTGLLSFSALVTMSISG
jgi:hypothetical protein